MNDFLRIAAGLFAVTAAPGALGVFSAFAPPVPPARLRLLTGVMGLSFGLLALVAVSSDSVLDWLDISAENFQVAAGLVMLPLALRLLWSGAQGEPSAASPFWRAWSLTFGPTPAVLMLSYSARFGVEMALGGAVTALLVSGGLLMASDRIAARLGSGGCSMLARLTGALVVLLAVESMINGFQSV